MDLRHVFAVLLALFVCFGGGAVGAQDPSEEDHEATEETAQAEASKDSDETNVTIKTVEYRVPEGGYLTDPAVVQDTAKGPALNRIFPLWKSIAKGHALPRPWSVGMLNVHRYSSTFRPGVSMGTRNAVIPRASPAAPEVRASIRSQSAV